MFTVANNGIIVINRGDTFECTLFIAMSDFPETTRYILTNTDILTFNIVYPGTGEYADGELDGIVDVEPALQHVYSKDGQEGHIMPQFTEDGDIIIYFSANEMSQLNAGTYYYEVVLDYAIAGAHRIDTIVPRTKMTIVE